MPSYIGDTQFEFREGSREIYELPLDASDADGDELSFAVVGGNDAELFSLVDGPSLRFNGELDYDSPGDSDGDNRYDVIVEVTDGTATAGADLSLLVTNSSADDDLSMAEFKEVTLSEASIGAPYGLSMGWVWAEAVATRAYAGQVLLITGTVDGLRGFTESPAVFFALREGRLENVSQELNPDEVKILVNREIIIADFDNDGWDDIFLSNHGTEGVVPFPGEFNDLMLQDQDGLFRDAAAQLYRVTDFSHGSSAGDLDGDGAPEIFVNNLGDDDGYTSYILQNDGDGRLSFLAGGSDQTNGVLEPDTGYGNGVFSLILDMDGDGDRDIFMGPIDPADSNAEPSGWFRNDGGRFLLQLSPPLDWPVPAAGLFRFEALDFDRDGDDDILMLGTGDELEEDGVVVGGRLVLQLYENNGAEGFVNVSSSALPGGGFSEESVTGGLDVDVEDVDGDGDPDIEVRTYRGDFSAALVFTFENERGERFREPLINAFHRAPRGKYLDMNGDGLMDIAHGGPDERVAVRLRERDREVQWRGFPTDDRLVGGDRDDELHGEGGDDTLLGNAGDDLIDGGPGEADVAVYRGPRNHYRIIVGEGDEVIVESVDASVLDPGRDVLLGVERLRFSTGEEAL